MMRLLFTLILFAALLGGGWKYIPAEIRGKALAAIGIGAGDKKPEEIISAFGDAPLLQQVSRPREAILRTLKENVAKIQKYAETASLPEESRDLLVSSEERGAPFAADSIEEIQKLVRSSSALIAALEAPASASSAGEGGTDSEVRAIASSSQYAAFEQKIGTSSLLCIPIAK